MKKLIAMATLMVALPASAVDCKVLFEYAEDVMTKRQNEVSMVQVMGTASDPVRRAVVLQAYQKPSFIGDKWKNNAIKSFANEVATGCYLANN